MRWKTMLAAAALVAPLATLGAAKAPKADTHVKCVGMPVGFHEFAIFGGDALYISHYAMFSSLHAFQVVAEVHLTAPDHDAQKLFIEHAAAHPGVHYTVSPYRNVPVAADRVKDQDDWILSDVISAGNTFNGDVHYRENGKDVVVDANVTVEVKRVLMDTILDPTVDRPKALAYQVFGNGNETYVAHILSAPPNPGTQEPDFDQVLRVTVVSGTPTANGGARIDGRDNARATRLTAGETATLTLDGFQTPLTVKVESEVFLHDVGTER